MPTALNQRGDLCTANGQFTTTHWSVVLAAGQCGTAQSAQALEVLCRTYWHPLYAYARRRGYPEHEAQDLTQEFFTRLLEKEYLRAVDRAKGKFRSFLLAAMEHFLAKEWRRAHAQKRGGGVSFLSFQDSSAGLGPIQAAAPDLSPEEFFDQQWAITLLEKAVGKLRQEFTAAGKAEMFEELKIYLTGEKREASYAELAARLDTTAAALKMAVSRMRQRYGELLRAEIASTVSGTEEVEEELRALLAALSGELDRCPGRPGGRPGPATACYLPALLRLIRREG
jgi:RNA polymerase sigma-70 factor (ECF subfamily)